MRYLLAASGGKFLFEFGNSYPYDEAFGPAGQRMGDPATTKQTLKARGETLWA